MKLPRFLDETSIVVLTVCTFLFLPSCGGGGGGGGSNVNHVCAALDRAARRCGVSDGSGSVGGFCGVYRTVTAYTECLAACMDDARCADVEYTACTFNRTVEDLDECTDACYYSEDYRCPDGEYIRLGYLCDEYPDCHDGSDEFGCEYVDRFVCGSGEDKPWSWQCDGDYDCVDGSDERDCATLLCE